MSAQDAERSRFLQSCAETLTVSPEKRGIGTLGEKTLHAVLKRYLDPDRGNWEVSVGPYVADIKREREILEIQTSGFHRLREKLAVFLPDYHVTVVYPVPAEKWLIWLEEDGSPSPPRRSPKHAGPWEVLPELYQIKPFLLHPHFHLRVLLLEVEEFRLKNGWSDDGKKGSSRVDRMPVKLLEEVFVSHPGEYGKLIPPDLPGEFTAKEFGKKTRLSGRKASMALNVLQGVDAIERKGKRGRAYLYSAKASHGAALRFLNSK